MPLQDPPPPPAHTQQQKTEQQKKKGPTIHQESKGGNSPNVVAGDHATVSINTAPVLSGTLKPSNDPTPPDSPNPNNYFKIKHPDPSTLVVFDQQGKEALNVHFMNPSAVRFTGLLYSAQGPIEITPTSLILPGQNIFRFGYMGGPTPTIMVFYEPAHP